MIRTKTHRGKRSREDVVPPLSLVTIPRSSAGRLRKDMVTKPHRTEVHQTDVPRPIVLSGSFSPRFTSSGGARGTAKIRISTDNHEGSTRIVANCSNRLPDQEKTKQSDKKASPGSTSRPFGLTNGVVGHGSRYKPHGWMFPSISIGFFTISQLIPFSN